ncbi:MAG: efflux RND transporter permease subunit, partial [Deltaproteobacteria bacterium]
SVALRDGAIRVALILLFFLLNWRATVISLVALPLSLVVGVFVLEIMGITLNTMTLGGFTIAIGSLVDDAIIDVENIIKRLRENRALPESEQRSMADIVYDASVEVRSAILYATLIIILVFVPLFFLSGLEGRMLAPLGLAYVTAIAASLLVAVTVTPAMSMYLLNSDKALRESKGPVLEHLERGYGRALRFCLDHSRDVLLAAGATVIVAMTVLPFLGRSFLPEFNEGALTVSVVTLPGTSLAESDRLGRRMEQAMAAIPEVKSTTRRTGRAELDEHAQDVSASEIDVTLDATETGRSKEEIVADVREALAGVPGGVVTVGQPLSHRIDHMLSGTRAALAVKIFGSDLTVLRGLAEQVKAAVESVDGAVDVSIEQQVEIPELEVRADRQALARFGMTPGRLAEAVEGRFAGRQVGVVVDELRTVPIVTRLTDDARESEASIAATAIDTPSGHRVPLRVLADLVKERGPNTIVREDVQRKLVVQANVAGRDIGSIVADVKVALDSNVRFPEGYYVELGGQFESAEKAARTILLLSIAVVVGILLLLTLAYASVRNAILTLATLPLALIGGVVAVASSSAVLTIPGLVGFITLFGIATRNGILMVSRFEHLTGERASRRELIVEGALDRLAPILMTALSAALALIPLAIAGNQPGNEIQAPMAIVILGGLMSSTVLTIFVLPVIFERWGSEARETE